MEHEVEVHGTVYRLTIFREPGKKLSWWAVGTYRGEELRVKGRSESGARHAWREAASHNDNL